MLNSSALNNAETARLERIVKAVRARRQKNLPPEAPHVHETEVILVPAVRKQSRPQGLDDNQLIKALVYALHQVRAAAPTVHVKAPEVHTSVGPPEVHVAAHLASPEVHVVNEVRPTDVKVENHCIATSPEVRVVNEVRPTDVKVEHHVAVPVPEVQVHVPQTKVYNRVVPSEVKVHNEVKTPRVVVEVDMQPVAEALERLAEMLHARRIIRTVKRDGEGRIERIVEEEA